MTQPTRQHPDEEAIFNAARNIGASDERSHYVAAACGDDRALAARVAALLDVYQREDSFLAPPVMDVALMMSSPAIAERPGAQIGPYKLMEQIGEGGFGLVFVAEQQQPVRRKVAIKVIKPGMDTLEVIARFEAERQALAMMNHPNIAHVFDAGATDSGRPYFVMELVRGVPITEYCDRNQLAPGERLELFISVCNALQHAHQKGIIHRDIKPSNVLVMSHDGQPVVKVIDFGVAKAIRGQLTEKTIYTRFAQMIGTPLYMSPEQAEMNALDVDTRTDIFSLGVLLYELLTGTTPFDRQRMAKAAYDEIRRIIREEEPPKPSTRLSDSGESRTLIASQRQTNPARLSKLVRGDLDWIVMKSLEKDRARRYETAGGFAADVRRFLNDETVEACPPSTWYRLRKLARRNRMWFAVVSAAVLVVLLGMTSLAVSNFLIRQEQDRTRDEKERAKRAQRLAEDRTEEIHRSLERLKAANSWLDRGRWLLSQSRWDGANAAFTNAVELRPDHASGWRERGELLAQLGLFDLAGEDYAREFEQLREPDTTNRWYRFALLRLSLGDEEGFRQIRRRMRERFQRTTQGDFAAEVVRTGVLAADSEEETQGLVEFAKNALISEPDSWYFLYLLGIAHYRAGDYEQAILQLRKSLTGYPEMSIRAMSYPALAMAHHRMGQAVDARQALHAAAEALDQWTRHRYETENQIDWVVHQGAVTDWPIAWWDWLECQIFYAEAKLLIDGSAPPADPRLHVLRARSFAGLRRNFTADIEYAAALKLRPDDRQIRLEAHRSAGYSAVGRQEWSRAAAEFASASELAPDDAALWRFRAVALLGAKDTTEYRRTCVAMLERFGKTAEWRVAGNVLLACAMRDDALPDMDRLISIAQVAAPWHHVGSYVLGAAMYRAGRYEEAIQCFETAAKLYRRQAWDWSFLAMAHHRLGRADEARRCLGEAAKWIDDANHQTNVDLSGTATGWGGWSEQVAYAVLFREAQSLLGVNK